MRGGHAHVQGGATSGDSSGGESISRLGLRSGKPYAFCGDPGSVSFNMQTTA